MILQQLADSGVPNVPRVICSAVRPANSGPGPSGPYIVLEPFGRHLARNDVVEKPELLAQVALDVAQAVIQAASVGVHHNDLSAMNIVERGERCVFSGV